MKMTFELIDPSHLVGMDLGKTVRRGIKSQAEPMRDTELGRVIDRTPHYTGALQADETGTFNTDPDDPELIHLWAGSEHQMAAASIVGIARIYAEAVEYGSVANRFNPMEGYHMFEDAETEDLQAIETLGLKGVQRGINDIVAGKGYRL